MRVAQQGNANCLNRALSTIRGVLGYDVPVPAGIPDGSKNIPDVVETMGEWFPNHQVQVMLSEKDVDRIELPANTEWVGESDDVIDFDRGISGFNYFFDGQSVSHFVVGTPCLYKDMRTRLVIIVLYNKTD